jgi:hypothetical protein
MMSGNYHTDGTPVKHFGGCCEAYDCKSVATTTINVKVDDHGVITLYLCESCVLEFKEDRK